MTDRELMQQALEALRTLHDENMDYLTRNNLGGENNQCMVFARETIAALRDRLAQPEQELVCVCGAIWDGQELVSTPTQRKPLTHPQIHELDWPDGVSFEEILPFVRAIEAKLQEKNHG